MEGKARATNRHKEALLGRYELGRLLGRGTFAKVYFGRSVADGSPVAIKVMSKPELAGTGMAHSILREVAVMRRLSHPNILRLHEVMATRSKIYLVMEHAPGGDLLALLARLRGGRLPEPAARRYFQQLISAIHYCHARGVSHRDVKPQNLLLDADGNLKVSDFGLSALPDQHKDDGRLHTACGTPAYTAPEVVRRRGYDGARADAWSCGVILFVLLAGALPFDDANLALMYRKIHKREYEFPPWVSPAGRKLVFRLLDPNPESRLTIKSLMDYPWFKRSLSLDSHLSFMAAAPVSPQASAVANDVELASSPVPAMNAFSIITLSSGLDLSGLFEEEKKEKEKRFTSTEPVDTIVRRIDGVGAKLGYVVEKRKAAVAAELARSGWTMKVEVYELLSPLLLVEMRLETSGGSSRGTGTGDGGGEGFSWEELRAELGGMVLAWDSSTEDL